MTTFIWTFAKGTIMSKKSTRRQHNTEEDWSKQRQVLAGLIGRLLAHFWLRSKGEVRPLIDADSEPARGDGSES
jgi:hypothetical protein